MNDDEMLIGKNDKIKRQAPSRQVIPAPFGSELSLGIGKNGAQTIQ